MIPVGFGSVYTNIQYDPHGNLLKPAKLRQQLTDEIRKRGERDSVAFEVLPYLPYYNEGPIATLTDYKFPVWFKMFEKVYDDGTRVPSMEISVKDEYNYWVEPYLKKLCRGFKKLSFEQDAQRSKNPTAKQKNHETTYKAPQPPWMDNLVARQS